VTVDAHWRALEILTDRLAASEVTWALSGTAALAAHGIDVTCRDLDVVTTVGGAHQTLALLPEFAVGAVAIVTRGNIRAHLGVLRIHECDVDVLGDVQNELPSGQWTAVVDVTPEFVVVDAISRTVPVLPLEQLLVAYRNMGRMHTASLISAALAQ
jgi:hypothetical protein